jgi:hypothetical protein
MRATIRNYAARGGLKLWSHAAHQLRFGVARVTQNRGRGRTLAAEPLRA